MKSNVTTFIDRYKPSDPATAKQFEVELLALLADQYMAGRMSGYDEHAYENREPGDMGQ